MHSNENNQSEKAGEKSAYQCKDVALFPFHRVEPVRFHLVPYRCVCGDGGRVRRERRDEEEKEGMEN